jgi:hypothetical protein
MAGRGWVEGTATGGTSPPVFHLCPNASRYTIAQELTHLVQGNGPGIPHGEVACDIWIISRLPIELLDQRRYYLLARQHSRGLIGKRTGLQLGSSLPAGYRAKEAASNLNSLAPQPAQEVKMMANRILLPRLATVAAADP